MSVGPNVNVLISTYQTITDGGSLSFAAGDTVSFNGAAVIEVKSGGTMTTATGDTLAITYGGGNTIQVDSGGELKAAGTIFNLDQVTLIAGSILTSTDLTGDSFSGSLAGQSFNTPLSVPYGDVQYLGGNASFQDIDIIADTIPRGTMLSLNKIGAGSALLYVFPEGFTIGAGASLSVGPNVNVLISTYQTITDGGLLSFTKGDTVSFNGAATIEVTSGGTMAATDDSFAITYGGGNTIQVDRGGQLTASNSSFALSSLTLSNGSNAQLAANSFANEFSINSGAIINITGNDFTNISNTSGQGIVASGDSTKPINLANNYWGSAPIAARITDHTTNPSLPTVVYNPTQLKPSPPGVAAVIAIANPTPVMFSTSSQMVTLSASVTFGATKVPGGSVWFTILDGINIIGTPVTATVANGLATTSYTLLGSTAAGTYTIQAIYIGTAGFLGDIEASQTLIVKPTATTPTVISSAPQGSVFGQTVIFTAVVTPLSPGAGTPTGKVMFKDGTTVLGSANLIGGTATLATSSLTFGNNSITAVYGGDTNFTTRTSTTVLTQTVDQDGTTTVLSTSAPQGSVFGQTIVFTAVVVPASPGTGTPTGTVTFKDSTTSLGAAAALNKYGVATFSISSLAVGSDPITAVYGSDTNFATRTSTPALSQTVGKDSTNTLLISSLNPSTFGQTVIFTDVVLPASPGTGTPTGKVTFYDGTIPLGPAVPLTDGVASFQTSTLYSPSPLTRSRRSMVATPTSPAVRSA